MQKLVDRMNLVSREILTGLSVIRAFSREKFEEKRFDEANRNLMKTQLFTNRVMTFMMPAMMLIMNCVTVMIVWFATLTILGIRGILGEPGVVVAVNPMHAVRFFAIDAPYVTGQVLAVDGGRNAKL